MQFRWKKYPKSFKQSSPDHLISVGTIGGIGDKLGIFFQDLMNQILKTLFY